MAASKPVILALGQSLPHRVTSMSQTTQRARSTSPSEPVPAQSLRELNIHPFVLYYDRNESNRGRQIGNPGDETPDSLSQSVSLVAGTTYTFTAYYSVLDLPLDSCHIRAVIAGTTVVEDLIYAGSGGGNPPGYYRSAGTYTSPATGPSDLSVELWCDMYSLGGVFGLDDVSLA